MSFKIGSLFDGSGGFPFAAMQWGGIPVWAAEVEPYPIAVTRNQMPGMKHLGSVTEINGAEIEPVDVISFGSPCQDLSVAGKRAGLKHEDNGDEETTRSGLFMDAIRIIKEMRAATNGVYPRFIVWENVPGAFSSSSGDDFRTVLQEIVKIVEPEAPEIPSPGKKGWPYADCIVGDGWSIAYRIFDAQFWGRTILHRDSGTVLKMGTPQRRRRVYLVADFASERTEAVLFESYRLRGHLEESGEAWESASGDLEESFRADDSKGVGINGDGAVTVALEGNGSRPSHSGDGYRETDTMYTLNATEVHGVAYAFEPGIAKRDGSEGRFVENASPTIRAKMGDNQTAVAYAIGNGQANQSFMTEQAGALNCMHDQQAVLCYDARGNGDGAIAPTITGDHNRRITDYTCVCCEPSGVAAVDCRNGTENAFVNGTLQAKPNGGISMNYNYVVRNEYIVRRLTPTECARLQGFPDCYGVVPDKEDLTDEEYAFWLKVRNTHAAINDKAVKDYTKKQMLTWYNKLHTDSAEYKMWGNGIALPCAEYVMRGIANAMDS